ncbi:MAG: RHS repeat-associated core domain-containing protein, partial [Kiritimatiellia bacterium]
KLSADGQGPCYTYTDDGNLATRTWARGVASATVYYNHRHYEPMSGRWTSRDPAGERTSLNLSCFVTNGPGNLFDLVGMRTEKHVIQTVMVPVNERREPFFVGTGLGSTWSRRISFYEWRTVHDEYKVNLKYTLVCEENDRADVQDIEAKDGDYVGYLESISISIPLRFASLNVGHSYSEVALAQGRVYGDEQKSITQKIKVIVRERNPEIAWGGRCLDWNNF